MKKELGKIRKAWFGMGGYQNCQMGIWFSFCGEGWTVGDGRGFWISERSESAKWTEKDRINEFGKIVIQVGKWLKEAKVSSVDELVGVPVEVTFDEMKLVSWRILKEVL